MYYCMCQGTSYNNIINRLLCLYISSGLKGVEGRSAEICLTSQLLDQILTVEEQERKFFKQTLSPVCVRLPLVSVVCWRGEMASPGLLVDDG